MGKGSLNMDSLKGRARATLHAALRKLFTALPSRTDVFQALHGRGS